MTLVDTHCHLHFPDFDADREAMIERARVAGVKGFVVVGTDPVTNERARLAASGHPDMVYSAGLHPHSAHEIGDAEIEGIAAWVREHRPAAIGEVGLDYFKSEGGPAVQQDRFARMIRIALDNRIPVIVHSRDAFADTAAVLRREGARQGVMHCFSYGREEMRAALDLGFHISFAGNVTFKNAASLADAAAFAPLDRIVIETDSPYLAPPPNRGKRNEPAFVAETAKFIAAKRGMPPEEFAEATTRNAIKIFGLKI